MSAVDLFLDGKMSLEDAVLSSDGQEAVTIFLALTWDQIVLGVREQGTAPVFTRIPVGAGAGPGVAASRVFDALDAMPPRKVLEGHQPPAAVTPTTSVRPAPSPEVKAGLVGALTAMAKEAISHAES